MGSEPRRISSHARSRPLPPEPGFQPASRRVPQPSHPSRQREPLTRPRMAPATFAQEETGLICCYLLPRRQPHAGPDHRHNSSSNSLSQAGVQSDRSGLLVAVRADRLLSRLVSRSSGRPPSELDLHPFIWPEMKAWMFGERVRPGAVYLLV